MTKTFKNFILLFITAVGLIVLFFIDPIPQDPAYHNFADNQKIFGIPNFFNVISNIPFIIIGIWGLTRIRSRNVIPAIRHHYIIFCAGILLIGFGSAYYHLHPNNTSLVWDRLPMTVAFMSFFSAVITEYISVHAGKKLLYPLLVVGITSVIYWSITENLGAGDLRPYAAVQYIPLALTPLILIMYEPNNTFKRYIVLGLIFYGLAKACEVLDTAIYSFFNIIISGHLAKHLFAALGSVYIVKLFMNKKA